PLVTLCSPCVLIIMHSFFYLTLLRPQISSLFPYTPLFRSPPGRAAEHPRLPCPRRPPAARRPRWGQRARAGPPGPARPAEARSADRKSTRLNSSHVSISYAVFCLKKKKYV